MVSYQNYFCNLIINSGILFGLFFDPEDESDMFLENAISQTTILFQFN
jgi:hypothetical protein